MKKDKKQINDPAGEAIKKHTDKLREIAELLNGNRAESTELPPEGAMYRMTIGNRFSVVSSDFIKNPVSEKLYNQILIGLTGNPSQGTPNGFSLAYLNFVDSGRPLQQPQLFESNGYLILFIHYPLSHLAMIEKMLSEAKICYCWLVNLSSSSENSTYLQAGINAEY